MDAQNAAKLAPDLESYLVKGAVKLSKTPDYLRTFLYGMKDPDSSDLIIVSGPASIFVSASGVRSRSAVLDPGISKDGKYMTVGTENHNFVFPLESLGGFYTSRSSMGGERCYVRIVLVGTKINAGLDVNPGSEIYGVRVAGKKESRVLHHEHYWDDVAQMAGVKLRWSHFAKDELPSYILKTPAGTSVVLTSFGDYDQIKVRYAEPARRQDVLALDLKIGSINGRRPSRTSLVYEAVFELPHSKSQTAGALEKLLSA